MNQLLPGAVRQQDSLRVAPEGRGTGRTFGGTQQAARIAEQKCTLTSPHGRQIEVPYALFEAFEDLHGRSGRIEVDVRHGGVAGVRTQKVLK